jgi:hypothetical protein
MNGQQIELSDLKPIAQTKQVNDLASLDNRQTNYTNTFYAPYTANNIRVMERVGHVGNQSNLPYSKNRFDLIDADNGAHIIYNGWATIKKTDDKGYQIYVHDGIVDFYRRIENRSLTEIGVSGLNHLKNLTTVINSWSGTEPYMYILADYNGKNLADSPIGGAINIDYQVPAAKVSYIWDQIFSYSNFTYSGSVFDTDDFTNLYMTFPKPVPVLNPITTLITDQNSEIQINSVASPTPSGGVEYVSYYYAYLFPSDVSTSDADIIGGIITIDVDGAYRVSISGTLTDTITTNGKVDWTLRNSSGVILNSGFIDGAINQSTVIPASATDKLTLIPQLTGVTSSTISRSLSGTLETIIEKLEGYDANFDEVLIDFKATEFVNEIMQRFGLTMFKDRFSDSLEFLTFREIFQDNQAEDWSSYFVDKKDESYILSAYAQSNYMKYRYNEDNETHNDGIIRVNNVNLKDNATIISSKIYSPEKRRVDFFGINSYVFRMCNKEANEDGVKYNDLTGRYYFLRADDYSFASPTDIVSESLNTSDSVTDVKVNSFSRLRYQEIIYDYYPDLEAMLDKAKMLNAIMYLKPTKASSFDFKRLIYLEQLGSYYLVNKISNFIKGKPVNCELIEIDYKKLSQVVEPFDGTYITITNIEIDGCDLIFTFDTDATLPTSILVSGALYNFGFPPVYTDPWRTVSIPVNPSTNTFTITVEGGQYWSFALILVNASISSNQYVIDNTSDCTYVPPVPDLTYINITSVETYMVDTNINTRYIKIYLDTDAPLPNDFELRVRQLPYTFENISYHNVTTGASYILATLQHASFSGVNTWEIKVIRMGIESNLAYSNS